MDNRQTAREGYQTAITTAERTRNLTAKSMDAAFFRTLGASMFWLMRREKKYSYAYALFSSHFEANRQAARILKK